MHRKRRKLKLWKQAIMFYYNGAEYKPRHINKRGAM